MKINDVFKTQYLKAADLPEEGQEFTIAGLEMAEFNEGKDTKPVVLFQEIEEKLVLNKTNWNTIVSNTNLPDSDDWIGKKVTLFPALVEFRGEQVLAIRVKADLKAALNRARGIKTPPESTNTATSVEATDSTESSKSASAGTNDDVPF